MIMIHLCMFRRNPGDCSAQGGRGKENHNITIETAAQGVRSINEMSDDDDFAAFLFVIMKQQGRHMMRKRGNCAGKQYFPAVP